MKRGTLGWYRMRAISGAVFGVLGVIIAVQIVVRPAPWNTKLFGFAFVAVALALTIVRTRDYLRARSSGK
ncbi:MAG: hypothetical protein NVSMB64_27490 [Candidatus Velthaea sp.]